MAETGHEQLKERLREIWAMGDYAKIADLIRPAARALVDACAISAGQEVLDVAAGNGNLAVIAGEEGASVVASDLSPGQVDLGRARTEREGLDVEWHVADVEALPFEDERFDCSASVFGAMFGPRPEVAAAEMFRVVRPGGTVGLAVWGPYGAQAEVFAKMAEFRPPLPDGVPDPHDWGVEEIAEQRLAPLASSLRLERRTMRYEFDAFDDLWAVYQAGGPGTMLAQTLEPSQLDRLHDEVEEIVSRWNQADGGRVVIEPEYLQIVARKRG